jgi:hypothetical protein
MMLDDFVWNQFPIYGTDSINCDRWLAALAWFEAPKEAETVEKPVYSGGTEGRAGAHRVSRGEAMRHPSLRGLHACRFFHFPAALIALS